MDVTEKQPKVKNVLLQTYLTSLLCMVLCVAMFLGTSYAWFTSEVVNTGNEIYIGVLDVELQKLDKENNNEWDSLSEIENEANKNHLYSGTEFAPGQTSLETLRVTNNGTLPFDYILTFTDGELVQATSQSEETEEPTLEWEAVAEWFDVWVFDHQNSSVEYVKPVLYADIAETKGWVKIGTLKDILSGEIKSIFKGEMTEEDIAEEDTAHVYTIALHMNGETVAATQEGTQEKTQQELLDELMGQKLGLSVKLIATQRNPELDLVTTITPESIDSFDFTQKMDAVYYLSGEFKEMDTINLPANANITIDGAGATFAEGAGLVINAPEDADSYSSAHGKERVGNYTITHFTGSGAISFVGYNTTVNVTNNKLGFLGLRLANVTANITGNTINGAGEDHVIWGAGKSEYGMYLNAADYDLTFTGNTVTNTKSHAIGINGRKADENWPGYSGENNDGTNVNVVANNRITFTGNTISGYASTKAALKIWDDTYFAKDKIIEKSGLNDAAKALINHVLDSESNNTITPPSDGYVFNFYDFNLDALTEN